MCVCEEFNLRPEKATMGWVAGSPRSPLGLNQQPRWSLPCWEPTAALAKPAWPFLWPCKAGKNSSALVPLLPLAVRGSEQGGKKTLAEAESTWLWRAQQ